MQSNTDKAGELDIFVSDYLYDLDKTSKNVAIERLMALIESEKQKTAKAYGACTKCYNKGYATVQAFVTGGGKKWEISPFKFCDCDRGKQLKELVERSKS